MQEFLVKSIEALVYQLIILKASTCRDVLDFRILVQMHISLAIYLSGTHLKESANFEGAYPRRLHLYDI